MSDFVPIANLMQARVQGDVSNGKRIYHLWHFAAANAAPTAADCEAVASILDNWVSTHYANEYSNRVTINNIRVRSLASEPGPVFEYTSLGYVGDLNGDPLPLSTTCRVNLGSGTTGPDRRGSLYAFLASENEMTGGLYTAGYMADLHSIFVALMTDSDTANYPWAIYSRHRRAFHPITSNQPSPIPAHLRSRRVDKGI